MKNTSNETMSNIYKLNQLKNESNLLKIELEKLYTSVTIIEKTAPRYLPENQDLYLKIDSNINYIVEKLSELHQSITRFYNARKNNLH